MRAARGWGRGHEVGGTQAPLAVAVGPRRARARPEADPGLSTPRKVFSAVCSTRAQTFLGQVRQKGLCTLGLEVSFVLPARLWALSPFCAESAPGVDKTFSRPHTWYLRLGALVQNFGLTSLFSLIPGNTL